MPRFVFRHFGRNRRTRTHDGHVALDDVEELRKFVEAELAEHVTERIDSWVVFHLEGFSARFVLGHEFLLAFFGVHVHAAELVHGEQLAVLADASLLEDDGPLRVADLDRQGAEQQKGRTKENRNACAGDVYEALDDVTKTDCVRVFPDVIQVQARKREKAAIRAVEILDFVGELQVVFFLETGVDIRFENGALGLDAECLDETRVIELMQDFFADGFKSRKVGIQEDDSETASVGQETEDVDKAQVREHGENTDTPGILDGLVGAAPAEKVVLMGINLDIQEGLASAVCSQKFFIQASSEKLCRVDNVLKLLFIQNRADCRIDVLLYHVVKYSKRYLFFSFF